MGAARRVGWALPAMALAAALAGCGTPGAPQPPSLNLPDQVVNLAATRAGSQVTLTWTMPKKTTDKILLKSDVPVRVCRREGAGECETAGAGLMLGPISKGEYVDTLPPALAAGAPRALSYFVELKSRNGRSAGLSNGAVVLAGEAPAPVDGFRLDLRKEGVALHWTPGATGVAVRLHRTLLTPHSPRDKADEGPLKAAAEPVEQNLIVEDGSEAGRALDRSVRTGETYEYRAQRVARLTVDGQTIELDGELSAPVKVDVLDVFPPAAPTGLAAVATAASTGADGAATAASIDLNWQPDSETDLAGYIVYRREGAGEWTRISPEGAGIAPAYHDAHVEAGHSYSYAVSAVDKSGHESARSAEARETVPEP